MNQQIQAFATNNVHKGEEGFKHFSMMDRSLLHLPTSYLHIDGDLVNFDSIDGHHRPEPFRLDTDQLLDAVMGPATQHDL